MHAPMSRPRCNRRVRATRIARDYGRRQRIDHGRQGLHALAALLALPVRPAESVVGTIENLIIPKNSRRCHAISVRGRTLEISL